MHSKYWSGTRVVWIEDIEDQASAAEPTDSGKRHF